MHLEKQYFPIDVTDSGIIISTSDSHSQKLFFLIDVTDSGIVILVNVEHPSNKRDGMDFMLPKIVRDLTPSKI